MPNKYSISLDIDGCLFDWLAVARRYFSSIPENPVMYSFKEYLSSLDDRIRFDLFLKSPHIVSTIQPYPGMLKFLDWVYTKFKDIYFVTGRDKLQEKATKKCFKDLGIPINNIILNRNKYKVVPDLGVLIHMEDDPLQLENLKKFKSLNLLVPIRSWNNGWIRQNISDYSIYPWKDYSQAKKNIENILERKEE